MAKGFESVKLYCTNTCSEGKKDWTFFFKHNLRRIFKMKKGKNTLSKQKKMVNNLDRILNVQDSWFYDDDRSLAGEEEGYSTESIHWSVLLLTNSILSYSYIYIYKD